MNEPIPGGPAGGRYCSEQDLTRMLREYYRLRGWSERGVPTGEKLRELGITADTQQRPAGTRP